MKGRVILPARTEIRDLSKEEMASYKDQFLSINTAEDVEVFVRKVSKQ